MRIGILKERLCIGGTERSAANASKILSKDHEVFLALYDAKSIKYAYSGNLVDFKLPASRCLVTKVLNNILRAFKYKRLIKKEKLDVLYEFISINSPLSMLRHKSAIRIISSRDFGVLSICTDRFNQCLERADAMICNSRYIKQYFVDKYPEQANKVFSVYNYIDTDEICKQSNEMIDSRCIDFIDKHKSIVVSVGRFCKEKGFEFLIEAVAIARKSHNDICLLLVGDGEYKEKYLEIIDRLKLRDHVFFTGFQENPYKYMARCSCFVLSSISEGFPNVLAEAMALGLPVIATNCFSGPAEILRKDADYFAINDEYKECNYGIISPAFQNENNQNPINELSKAMVRLLSDEEMYKRYHSLSLQRSLDFSTEATRNNLNEILNILCRRRGITDDHE